LEGSGLPLRDGVECDERLRVVGWPDIHAAGDVARWPHAFYESVVRIEHWTNANEHAAIVAADLTGAGAPRVQVPYVWSDQYGHRLQIVGSPRAGTALLVRGTSDDPVLALYVDTAGQVVGAVVQDDPRALMKCTKAIAARSDAHELSDALGPSRRT
jgi:3-phenylpropionate/trans-cinnamate dioxygenase ferredoxin reductase subunit